MVVPLGFHTANDLRTLRMQTQVTGRNLGIDQKVQLLLAFGLRLLCSSPSLCRPALTSTFQLLPSVRDIKVVWD